jgi:hypothetical protein
MRKLPQSLDMVSLNRSQHSAGIVINFNLGLIAGKRCLFVLLAIISQDRSHFKGTKA